MKSWLLFDPTQISFLQTIFLDWILKSYCWKCIYIEYVYLNKQSFLMNLFTILSFKSSLPPNLPLTNDRSKILKSFRFPQSLLLHFNKTWPWSFHCHHPFNPPTLSRAAHGFPFWQRRVCLKTAKHRHSKVYNGMDSCWIHAGSANKPI